jgi:hypothetical protein
MNGKTHRKARPASRRARTAAAEANPSCGMEAAKAQR